MYSKIKQFLDAVPRALTSANEIYNFARTKYKQMMGVFPDGLDDVFLKRGAAEMQDARQKVIKFPEGGKDKTDFFSTRPDPRVIQPKGAKMDVIRANENIAGGSGYAKGDTKFNADVLADEIALMRGANREDLPVDDQIKLYGEAYDYLTEFNRLNKKATGEFGITVLDDAGKPLETKATTPEGIMDYIMKSGLKGTDITGDTFIGKAPKTIKKKPAVDPELQKAEDQKQMFLDFEDRNKTRPGKINYDKMGEFLGVKLRGDETFDELLEIEKNLGKPKKADGGRIGFGSGSVNPVGLPGNQTEQAQPQPQEPGPMGPVFETGDIGEAAKEVMTRMAGSGIINIPMGGGFGLDFGLGDRRSIDAGISFNPQNPNFNFQAGAGILQGKPVIGAQFSKSLSGGRFGFKDGSKPKDPSRRTFMKGIAGLAALPFIGKLLKPAAKVVQTAGPVIAEGAKLGFEKFMMLVDKIKRLGRKTDAVTQKEREVGYTYQGKDGSEYELVEDLTTGDVRITKDKPGGMTVGDKSLDVIEDRSTFYVKRGQADETTKGKTPPDEYDEVKEISGPDGTFDDIDEVDNETVKEILEELGETRTKKASGGLAYMLGE